MSTRPGDFPAFGLMGAEGMIVDISTCIERFVHAWRTRPAAMLLVSGAMLFGVVVLLGPVLFPLRLDPLSPDAGRSVTILDRHERLVAQVRSHGAWRSEPVSLEAVSPSFLEAIRLAEDKRFYEHGGVDWISLVRAIGQNMLAGKVKSGASTITLQLARLIHPAARTYQAKLWEMLRAWRLEGGMSKREILCAYINRLPFANQVVGVEAASQAYFGVAAKDLSLAQAVFLAAVPNAPTRYNPIRHPEAVKNRQDWILQRMLDAGEISTEAFRLATKERLVVRNLEKEVRAPHFIRHLLQVLPEEVNRIDTSLDLDWQNLVEQRIQHWVGELKDRHVTNAAVLVLDTQRGEVLAYAGSADYFNWEHGGQVDGVQSLRQPGSALKPFLYGLALENGHHLSDVLPDLEIHLPTEAGDFSPDNYSRVFHGPVRLREALANSLNVPAVLLAKELGPQTLLETLHQAGMDSLNRDASHYGVGLTLGNGEVTLWELTRAFRGLLLGGEVSPLRLRSQKPDQKALPALDCLARTMPKIGDTNEALEQTLVCEPSRRFFREPIAFLLKDALSDPQARAMEFGLNSPLRMPFDAAVKTGTSRDFHDNWTVGGSRLYTVGVWVGNFDGSPMGKVSGVTGAGRIWADVMRSIHGRKKVPDFEVPEGLLQLPICPLSGKAPGPDCPHSVLEWFRRGESTPERAVCDWHKKVLVDKSSGRIAPHACCPKGLVSCPWAEWKLLELLPSDYAAWQQEAKRPVPVAGLPAICQENMQDQGLALETDPLDTEPHLAILRPGNGAIYTAPTDLAPAFQSLTFRANAPRGRTLIWLLNGTEVGRSRQDHQIRWSSHPGRYTLSIHLEDDPQHSATVHFQVKP